MAIKRSRRLFILINSIFLSDKLWLSLSLIAIVLYLSILFNSVFYVPIFDNLDSNVVWYKILSESGKIFASSDAIIPNMLNGLPRSSFGSEFNLVLWLYYCFDPETAFTSNEVVIHIIAFLSMFIFLKRYIVKKSRYYNYAPAYAGAIYFALLPFWSGAGASIALLPIVTYALLNISNRIDTKWDWILLILLPLYSSFILVYFFYIILAFFYLSYDAVRNNMIDKSLLAALVLMGFMFLIKDYRLVCTILIDPIFVSHRVEFEVFFQDSLFESYRLALVNFLQGHKPHADSLHFKYILPVVVSSLVLSLISRRLNRYESLVIWLVIILSFASGIWQILLVHKYTLPAITIFVLFLIFLHRNNFKNNTIPFIVLLIIAFSIFAAAFMYDGLNSITESFPFLKTFNLVRIIFVNPLLWGIAFTLSVVLLFRKVKYTAHLLFLLMLLQVVHSYEESFYQSKPKNGYASFEDYYAPKLFNNVVQELNHQTSQAKVINYGIEPAVALYNGLYTVDGYSVNYPLIYKHQFRKVFSEYSSGSGFDIYDKWGSKVYIMTLVNRYDLYQKGLRLEALRFSPEALCELNTAYMITPYWLKSPDTKNLSFIKRFKGTSTSWDIYLYKLHCMRSNEE